MMTKAALVTLGLLLAVVPAEAQRARGTSSGARVQGTFASGRPSFPTHTFSGGGIKTRDFHQGFGFSFGFSSGFPVFGLGFDAHHFSQVRRQRFAVQPVLAPLFFPFGGVASTTVVIVPQVMQVPVPVVIQQDTAENANWKPARWVEPAERLVGTPRAEERVQVVAPGLPGEPPPAPRLTLLVFKNHSIYAVTDYWLADGRLHYITSYGGQNAVPLELIDLDMTVRLNWERGMEFALRPEPTRH